MIALRPESHAGTAVTAAPRRVTCRMTDRHHDQCTGEALDPNGEVLICATHAAAVMRLVNERLKPTKRRTAA